jgi:hypothetical protein
LRELEGFERGRRLKKKIVRIGKKRSLILFL